MQLKYGCNPHQRFAEIVPLADGEPPIRLVHGTPSYVNLLDAINGFQLVIEAKEALQLPAAASFKHVSPAGAAVAVPLEAALAEAYEVGDRTLTPAALAYVRARGADPKSSFGDFAALSETVDLATATLLKPLVSDGIIAPGYDSEALAILKQKKKGTFVVLEGNPEFRPPSRESRELYGMRLTQDRNCHRVTLDDLKDVVCGTLSEDAKRDLVLGMVTLKYTQSNSVGYVLDGQMIGIGAGQQSRVDCTKLAGEKAAIWHLMRHPRVRGLPFKPAVGRQDRINWRVRMIEGDLLPDEQVHLQEALSAPLRLLSDAERAAWRQELSGVSLVSDAFFPFPDNISHARKYGVQFIAQPGGSVRDEAVTDACRAYGIAMAHTHVRLFHH